MGIVLLPLVGAVEVTTNATVDVGALNTYNASAGALAPPLPSLAGLTVGAWTVVEKSALDVSANTVTITRSGTDTFSDGSTTLPLTTPGMSRQLMVAIIGGTRYWKVIGGVGGASTNTVELGGVSDTTLSRASAGRLAVEGVNVVTTSSTDTMTNKTLTSPTLTGPILGTPVSGTLTNCTGLPAAAIPDGVRSVTVVTGSEARPTTTGTVLWIGGATQPTNYNNTKDIWFGTA